MRAHHPRACRVPGRRPSARKHRLGFWMIAAAFLTAMAFSTVPTPLYPLYQARDGFSTFTVTIVFAVYAVGVLASLLLAGHVSDWVGRRKVLIAALLFELIAAALFLTEPSLPILITARLVTGFGVGMLTATATAHLHDLDSAYRPGASPQRFEIVSTVANLGGLGVGSLLAGILAQYLRAPLFLPYLVFAALLLISIAAVLLTPETVEERLVRPAYRPQRISTDHGDPAGYLAAAVGGFASFAIFGLFTSLAPGFVGGALHHPSRALAGLMVFAVFGAAAAVQTLARRASDQARRTIGLLAQAVGAAVVAIGMDTASLGAFLVGGIAAGIGAGLLFKSAVGAVAAMARPATRGEALAGLFLVSYLGLAVPPLALGTATRYIAETTAVTSFTAVLLTLLTVTGLLTRRAGGRGNAEPDARSVQRALACRSPDAHRRHQRIDAASGGVGLSSTAAGPTPSAPSRPDPGHDAQAPGDWQHTAPPAGGTA